MNRVDWNEQFKIRPRSNASRKHEVIKILLVLNLIEKNRKQLYWIRIYTEFPVVEGKICDVYFENTKSREVIAYEIQKKVTPEWIKETNKEYAKWKNPYLTIDWVLVKETDLSNDIEILGKQIKELII